MQVNSSTDQYGLPDARKQPVKTIDKDAFLQLFITQLKNQDPMTPQDSNAFTAQMAQFSMLEQLTNLAKDMDQLKQSQEVSEASALLGRQVSVQTSDGVVSGSVEKVTLTSDAVQVFVKGTGYGLAQVTEIK